MGVDIGDRVIDEVSGEHEGVVSAADIFVGRGAGRCVARCRRRALAGGRRSRTDHAIVVEVLVQHGFGEITVGLLPAPTMLEM